MTTESAILIAIVATPMLGAGAVLALPARAGRDAPRGIAALSILATLFLQFLAAQRLDWLSGERQLLTTLGPPLAADARSMVFAAFAGSLGFLACWASFGVRNRLYFALFLFVIAMGLGSLFAQSTTESAIFLLAAGGGLFPLVHQWGYERRERAARRMSIVWLVALGVLCIAFSLRRTAFVESVMLISLGSLLALPPFHRWLAEALTAVPAPLAVLLTSILQPAAAFIMIRAFPSGLPAYAGVAGGVCAVYATLAILSAAQDLRRIAAYVSSAHMGLLLVTLSTGTLGTGPAAHLLLCGHALSMAMIVFASGMIRDRTGHADVARLGGLGEHMPTFAAWSGMGALTAVGLPGLAFFPGLYLAFMTAFKSAGHVGKPGAAWPAVLGIVAVFLLAGGLLWTYQRVFMGSGRAEHSNLAPLSFTEKMVMWMLGIFSLAVGIAPSLLSSGASASLNAVTGH